ncbi:MAG: shikimate kinase [Bacteroidetes bacterium]|nr:shikimate kinase [Bacteroidota bacterium]
MGSGKSTLGKKIAAKINSPFIDLDELIEKNENMSITKIITQMGESYFRECESRALQKLFTNSPVSVISLGGGTVCYNNNLNIIKQNAKLIYIKLSPQALYSRLINFRQNRPLLADISKEQLLQKITEDLNKRNFYYEQADLIYDGLSINLQKLIAKILLLH